MRTSLSGYDDFTAWIQYILITLACLDAWAYYALASAARDGRRKNRLALHYSSFEI
jgi:hypothetical protein